jgi:MFS family permease
LFEDTPRRSHLPVIRLTLSNPPRQAVAVLSECARRLADNASHLLRKASGMSPTLCGLPRGQVAAIVAIAGIVPAVLLMAPAIAGQLGAQLGLGPGQIGKVFSSELAGMSLATIPAWWWQKRVDWRLVAVVAALLFIVANIASALAVAHAPLLVLRFISALGGGTLMVICMASAAGSSERDRLYGLWVCGQLVLGALGLWLLPRLFTVFGLSALYVGLAVLVALCFPLLKQFPRSMLRLTALHVIKSRRLIFVNNAGTNPLVKTSRVAIDAGSLIKGKSTSSSMARLPSWSQTRSYSRRTCSFVGWTGHSIPRRCR